MPPDALDFSKRADLTELMDAPCSREVMQACLRDLSKVNRWFLGYRPTLTWLDSLDLQRFQAPIQILDVGCGYGDTLRRIEAWTQDRFIQTSLVGCDLNPDTIAIAADSTPKLSKIEWVAADIFSYRSTKPIDIIVSSLFTHHLVEADIVRFLQWMEEHARVGWFINDLSRAPIPYHLFKAFSRLVGLHPFVQHDGPVSFARAFLPTDWCRMCAAAGLPQNEIVIEAFTPGPSLRGTKEAAEMTTRDCVENLVIGGGLAGSMVAIRLAAAGREVVLIEKEREPHHKVCGEFLSAEAIHYLRNAGIEPLDLGAHPIQRVRLHSGTRNVAARLPFTALSLSRHILDESLLLKAQLAGCSVLRGACVERLEGEDGRWSARLRDGKTIHAKTAFLATGKHDLNAWERGGATQPDLVGFKMHWHLTPAQSEILRGVMELFLFRGGYGGLSLVEGGTANLCLVIRRNTLRRLGGWPQLLHSMRNELPALHERLTNAVPCWTKPLAISPIPYGHLGGPANGVWRVGDQAAVIPSFTGDGMSIALHSGFLAAKMYLDGNGPDEYLLRVTNQLRTGMRFASALSRAMVTPAARALAPALLLLVPSAIARIALSTRIPDRALLTRQISADAPIARQASPIA